MFVLKASSCPCAFQGLAATIFLTMREKDTIQTKNTLSQTAKLGLNGIVNIPNICNRGRVIPGRVQIIKRLKYEGVEIG